MAKRRRPQPRDNRGRYTKTGIPLWFGVAAVVLFVVSYIR